MEHKIGNFRSPFKQRLVKRPAFVQDTSQLRNDNRLVIDPPRFIKLGIVLDPMTGQPMGDFFLPFDTREHEPAIIIIGGSGSGKSTALARIHSELSFQYGRSQTIFDFKNQYRLSYMPNDDPKHIEILKANGESPRGIGNVQCMTGDNNIRLRDGSFITIKYLYDNFNTITSPEVLSCNDVNYNIEFKHIKNIVKRRTLPNEKIYEIKTIGGHSLNVTGNHKVYTWNNGLKEKHASRLTTNDYLISSRHSKIDISNSLLQDSDVVVLSYLLGDGHFGKTKNMFQFINTNQEMLDDFENNIKKSKFTSYRRIQRKGTKYSYIIVNSGIGKGHNNNRENDINNQINKFKSIFNINPMTDLDSNNKYIPDIIFKTSLYQKSLFLNRLFSCDGTVSKTKSTIIIEYSSNSIDLCIGISQLLLDFGINSAISNINNGMTNSKKIGDYISYRLSITGASNLKLYLEKIGFIHKDKHDLLSNNITGIDWNIIPNIKLWLNRLYNQIISLSGAKYRDMKNKVRNKLRSLRILKDTEKSPTRHSLKEILNVLVSINPKIKESFDFKNLSYIINSDIIFYKIKKITNKIDDFVYDIEVNDNHNFFTGSSLSFLIHNCFLPVHIIDRWGEDFCRANYNYTSTWRMSINDCDAAGLLMLGQKDIEGRGYVNLLDAIMSVLRRRDGKLTIDNVKSELDAIKEEQPASRRSADSLLMMIDTLVKTRVLADDGNSILELMHAPKKPGKGGDFFIFNLSGAGPNDIQTKGMLVNLINGVCHTLKTHLDIQPVIGIEEASTFFGRSSSQYLKDSLSQLHYVVGRTEGIFRIYVYQKKEQIPEGLLDDKGVPIVIETLNNFTLGNGEQMYGAGLAKVYLRHMQFMPNDASIIRVLPPKCKIIS